MTDIIFIRARSYVWADKTLEDICGDKTDCVMLEEVHTRIRMLALYMYIRVFSLLQVFYPFVGKIHRDK